MKKLKQEEFFEFPTRGLFIDDYSKLPKLTTDLEQAKSDIDIYGYCMLQEALSPEQVKYYAALLMEQSGGPRKFEGVKRPGPPGRAQLGNLQNRGDEFLQLMEHPLFISIARHVLGERFIMQIFQCPFHLDGMQAWPLHSDSWWMPPPQRKSAPPRLRVGSVTRTNALTELCENENNDWIFPSVRCPAVWMITDYRYSNGATMIMPGSHLSGRHPSAEEAAGSGVHLGAIPLLCPAGTLVVYDARLWHQSGNNQGAHIDPNLQQPWRVSIFSQFCAPQIRQQENMTLTTDRSVIAGASPQIKATLGLEGWYGIGTVNGVSPLTGTEVGLSHMSCAGSSKARPAVAWGALSAETLSKLTTEIDRLGYAILESGMTEDRAENLVARAHDQAQAEINGGVACEAIDGRQSVLTLVNKGAEFVELLLHEGVNTVVKHVIGEEFLLSSASASVPANSGGGLSKEGPLRTTQWWMPQPIRADKQPPLRPGSLTPELAGSEVWASSSQEFIAPPVSAAVVWCCDSNTTVRLLPGSHLSGRNPSTVESSASHLVDGMIELALSPGNVLLLDGRTWFATSCTGTLMHYDYVGPQFRTAENNVLATTTEALELMPPAAKEQLGFKIWFSYGGHFGKMGAGITEGPRALIDGPV